MKGYGSFIYAPIVRRAKFGAVRYVVSLSDIDSQLIKVILLMCFIALVIIAFVTVSGLFFVRSIVRPVKKINETAIKIARETSAHV